MALVALAEPACLPAPASDCWRLDVCASVCLSACLPACLLALPGSRTLDCGRRTNVGPVFIVYPCWIVQGIAWLDWLLFSLRSRLVAIAQFSGTDGGPSDQWLSVDRVTGTIISLLNFGCLSGRHPLACLSLLAIQSAAAAAETGFCCYCCYLDVNSMAMTFWTMLSFANCQSFRC